MRVGLVLGSGGIVGASYLVGALEAIHRQTGWEPRMADRIVGTSAGAFIGALVCALPEGLLYSHCTGDRAERQGLADSWWGLAERLDSHNAGSWWQRYPLARHWPRPALSSPRACASLLRTDTDGSLVMGLVGLIGEGLFSNRPIGAIIREACAGEWPHPGLHIAACDLDAGHRVVFDPQGDIPVHQAVVASTAVPGLFAPVEIGGRRHVDGGAWSASNLDLMAQADVDLVLAIVPFAGGNGADDAGKAGPLPRLAHWLDTISRRHVDSRLAAERAVVEARGTRVIVLTPTEVDRAGSTVLENMNLAKRPEVMAAACRATTQRLIEEPELAELVRLLKRESGVFTAREGHATAR